MSKFRLYGLNSGELSYISMERNLKITNMKSNVSLT